MKYRNSHEILNSLNKSLPLILSNYCEQWFNEKRGHERLKYLTNL